MSKGKKGRKGVLTPKISEELLTARENGLNQRDCAFYANINPSTLNNWLFIGKNSKRGKYHNFWLKWERSQVNRSAALLSYMLKEAEHGDWRAADKLYTIHQNNIKSDHENFNTDNVDFNKLSPDEVDSLKDEIKYISLVNLKDYLLNNNISSDVKVDKCMRFISIFNTSMDENLNFNADNKSYMDDFIKAQSQYMDKLIELEKVKKEEV